MSCVIRDIKSLVVSEKTKQLANELILKIDMPVVFCLDSELDKNYFDLHSYHNNQFWINIKPQKEQCEFERLVISGLFYALIQRYRYKIVKPKTSYFEKVEKEYSPAQKQAAIALIGKINSFSLSLIREIFLQGKGYDTSKAVNDDMFTDRIKKLNEYIAIRRTPKAIDWYKEIEISNMLDYGNYCRKSSTYKSKILSLIKKIKPNRVAYKYFSYINRVSTAILQAYSNFDGKNIEQIYNKFIDEILEIFQIKDWYNFDVNNARGEFFPFGENITYPIYSFVPEDLENQEILVKGIRYSKEFIVLFQEYNDLLNQYHYPNITVNLIDSALHNAYANHDDKQDEYYISIMSGCIFQLFELSNSSNIDNSKAPSFTEKTAKEAIFKYSLYFVAAHEYTHILNGDCDNNRQHNLIKEKIANKTAENLIFKLIPCQAEYHDKVLKGIICIHRLPEDFYLAKKAIENVYSMKIK